MDDNTRAVLVLALSSGTTIFVAWLKTRNDRAWYEMMLKNKLSGQDGSEPPLTPPPSSD